MAHLSLLRTAGFWLGDLVLPRVCASCGAGIRQGTGELCYTCWRSLEQTISKHYCKTCGEDRAYELLADGLCTRCRLKKPGSRFHALAKVGRYDGPLKSLLLQFKRRFVLDKLLGRLLGDAILGRFDPASVDAWVPVPSHWRRRLSLGFHPTSLLARATVSRWGGRVEPFLYATRYVPPFHTRGGFSARAREAAIRGAFNVPRGIELGGGTVCIIDDVTTTGATLREAERALRAGGVERILAAVVASASGHPPVQVGLDLE